MAPAGRPARLTQGCRATTLADVYRRNVQSRKVEKIVADALKNIGVGDEIKVPADLGERVRSYLEERPDRSWDQALRAMSRDADTGGVP